MHAITQQIEGQEPLKRAYVVKRIFEGSTVKKEAIWKFVLACATQVC